MNVSALVKRGRGPMLEFMPEPDAGRLAELIVAFANAVGGTIIVGMDEQGQVHPDVAENLEPALARALRLCDPAFRPGDLPEWHPEETPRGEVVAIMVKPTSYQLSVEGKETFVRSGTLNVRLSPRASGPRRPQRPAGGYRG